MDNPLSPCVLKTALVNEGHHPECNAGDTQGWGWVKRGSAAEQKSSSDVDSQKKLKSYLASRDDLLVRKKKRCTDEAPFIMSQHKSGPRREEHGVWLLVVAGQP